MVLSDQTIRRLAEDGMIRGFHEEGLQPASYDMRLFPTILVSPTRYESGHMVELTQETDNMYALDTGRFVGVLTEESLSMPLDVSARFGLRSEFTRRGLVAFGGIQVDPGFKGRLAISLFNAGPEPIEMHAGRRMFTVEFQRLDAPAAASYAGEFQGLEGFSEAQRDFILNAQTASLAEITALPGQVAGLERRLARFEAERATETVAELAARQGVRPTKDLSELAGGWPEDEDINEFREAVMRWRRQG